MRRTDENVRSDETQMYIEHEHRDGVSGYHFVQQYTSESIDR